MAQDTTNEDKNELWSSPLFDDWGEMERELPLGEPTVTEPLAQDDLWASPLFDLVGMAPDSTNSPTLAESPIVTIPEGFSPQSYESFQRLLGRDDNDAIQLALEREQASFQSITDETAHGDLNFDEFMITIDKMPLGMTPERFIDELLKGPNHFLGSEDFNFWSQFNRAQDGLPSVGDIYHIDIAGPDDGSVMLTDLTDSRWQFSIVEHDKYGLHPLNGAREFGFEQNADESITFYTRGISRENSYINQMGDALFFDSWGEGAKDRAWMDLMKAIETKIEDGGGVVRPDSINFTTQSIEMTSFNDELGHSQETIADTPGQIFPSIEEDSQTWVEPFTPIDEMAPLDDLEEESEESWGEWLKPATSEGERSYLESVEHEWEESSEESSQSSPFLPDWKESHPEPSTDDWTEVDDQTTEQEYDSTDYHDNEWSF